METISKPARELLSELTVIPQVLGYDHRVSELHDAKLIQWIPGQGYFISDAGREALAQAHPHIT